MTAPSNKTPARPRRDFEALPFIRAREPGAGFDYWAVEPSGSYTEDCERGREYARRFLDLDATHGNISLLGCIAVSMMEKGLVD